MHSYNSPAVPRKSPQHNRWFWRIGLCKEEYVSQAFNQNTDAAAPATPKL